MGDICTSDKAWETLKALIPDVPEHTRRLVLTFEYGELVTADIEYYPDISKPDTITQSYRLVPIDDESNE